MWARLAALSLGSLGVLGALQLTPLPPAVHAALAPASDAIWHPAQAVPAAVLGSASRPVSLDPAATWRWMAFSGAIVGLALGARGGLRSRTAILGAASAAVAAGVLVAMYGLVARLLFGTLLYGFLDVPSVSPFGPFVNKNHFAGYVELCACLALGLAAGLADEARSRSDWMGWLDSPRAGWVVAAYGAAAALALAVPVSLSRGGAASLALGLMAFALIRLTTSSERGSSVRAAALIAAALVTLVVSTAVLVPDSARRRMLSMATGDPYRLSVWQSSFQLFARSPMVGVGLGAFEDALPRFKAGMGYVRIEHAENDYVEMLADSGAAGLGLTLLAAAGVFVTGWRGVSAENHRLARGIRSGALAGLCAMAAHSFVDFNLRIPSNALLAGLLLALAIPGAKDIEKRGVVGRLAAVLLPGAALAAVLVGGWASPRFHAEELRLASSPGARLRAASLERAAVEQLNRRPADAAAWAALAWLRLPRAPVEADALAAWSQWLDPQSPLHAASQRIRDHARGPTGER
jgi:hypothetical protein